MLPDSNLAADMASVRLVLESGVPFILAPTDLALGVVLEAADGPARFLAQHSRDWLEL